MCQQGSPKVLIKLQQKFYFKRAEDGEPDVLAINYIANFLTH